MDKAISDGPLYIPGDVLSTKSLRGALRVDHAGEFGATRIYKGQLDATEDPRSRSLIAHMGEQEQQHLQFFEQQLPAHRARPSILHPLWKLLGYGLGFGTAKMGPQAAMACTVAVEETIDKHYQDQIGRLEHNDPAIARQLEIFRAEELEHRDTALEHGAEQTPNYGIMYRVIGKGSRLAIWLSERI